MGPVKTGTRGRRAVPWAVAGLWVAALVLLWPLAGKFADVQQNRAVDYLPDGADSTQVARVQDELPGGESTDLVVVYHRDGGLTAADRETAAAQIAEMERQFELSEAPQGVPSADGSTLMYPVSSTEPGQDEEAQLAFVDGVRETVGGTGGLSAEVGGSGAVGSDMDEVFDTIDGTLLTATLGVVTVLLVLIYRSPFLWLVPLAVAGAATLLAMVAAYGTHELFGITITGQSGGIMTVLVLGAGTDYALLLVSRYREELRRHERPYDAMRAALRGCGPAVLASSGTVAAGLLCLLAADLNSSSGMGPVGMVGVLAALVAMTTLLPAVLVLLGRRVFWPLIPAYGSEPKARRSLFAAMGTSATRRPAAVLTGGAVLLGALALGTLNLGGDLRQEDAFTDRPESVAAMRTLAEEYPERSAQPITVIAPAGDADEVVERVRETEGVAEAAAGRAVGTWAEITVFATAPPESAGETRTIEALRDTLDGTGAHVGGPSAEQLDLARSEARDRAVIVPLVLAAVFLILVLLLRSLVAPLLLLGAVVAVWGAALGIGGLVFGPLLGFAGTDPGIGLLSFVFLVALGVDYGIFLMHRMREESLNGAEPEAAALTALRTTGGVIASAGVVLAATFAVLTTLPLVAMVELGFVIAVGVLLDTFLVRTYLVTTASVLLGRRMWWPGALSRTPEPERGERQPEPV
ncbi:MMPL family transporter [Streptomyces sp. Vc74B-19]|uniref:MMPL family transporter n=2 Tax=Streptomyces TaxID=1883 RepID=UPI001BFC64D6|nr:MULTISPECIES: MMPL family transporter [unclassified Streptomyces]MBT3164093.1 MMPL family transporter [Streptomyces sp. Vc74B-19]MCO4697450.1 MMPL family transporter [Streptomyces sp. RO-S4]